MLDEILEAMHKYDQYWKTETDNKYFPLQIRFWSDGSCSLFIETDMNEITPITARSTQQNVLEVLFNLVERI